MKSLLSLIFVLLCVPFAAADDGFPHVWITFSRSDAECVTISWTVPAQVQNSSVLRYGVTESCPNVAEFRTEETPEFHICCAEIEIGDAETIFYQLESCENHAPVYSFRTCRGADPLKIAVVGNAHGQRLPDALRVLDPEIVATAGDNVPTLRNDRGVPARENVRPFLDFLAQNRDFLATRIFMPTLGNHDREIAPRGERIPGDSVSYDVSAAAYLRVFPLPDPGWTWYVDFPAYSARLVSLDLNHTSDFGTTLQTSHDWHASAPMFAWYREAMATAATRDFTITLQNEASSVRNRENGAWAEQFTRGTCTLTGFGHFGERVETRDGNTFYNTSLIGRGDRYPDAQSAALYSRDNFAFLTLDPAGPLTVQLRAADDGEVLDEKTFLKRTEN